MGARRSGRIVAFILLYRYELSETSLSELLDMSWIDEEICKELSLGSKKISDRVKQFASLLLTGCIENIEQIDMTREVKKRVVYKRFKICRVWV